MKYKHIYGPITSRRLGKSLGINLLPHKTCSFDCVYCECGKTTLLTNERKEYIPTKEVIEELKDYLSKEPELDYITFAGSGEPTLHVGIGEIISFIKENFPKYKVALLTNSTLLSDPEVRKEIKSADLIVPSLDAVTQKAFEKIDCPHEDIDVQNIIHGIKELQKEYTGELWIEIFIVPGVNDTEEELNLFKEILQDLNVKKVQLNSLDRPGVVDWIKSASRESLEKIANILGDVEIV